MSATDELRRLLDERGVEWRKTPHYSSESQDNETVFEGNGIEWYANDHMNGRLGLRALRYEVTPAQAIDATLGRGTCEVEDMVPLPVDADGVPIHVGERVQIIGNDPGTVSHMSLAEDGWRVYVKYDGDLGTGSGQPSRIRHHHAPTVEDVLREFGAGWYERMSGSETFDIADYVEEYAAKLTLRGDE